MMQLGWWGRMWRVLVLSAWAIMMLIAMPNDTPAGNSVMDQVVGKANDYLFDFVAWETAAITNKIDQTQAGLAPYLDEAQRSQYVVDYFAQVAKIHTLQTNIADIYGDPNVSDPAQASADLRHQRDMLRNDLTQRQPLAESIIETQVAAILAEEGFSTLGYVFPPVSAHIDRLPMLLVISPRERIALSFSVSTVSLTTEQQEQLEAVLDRDLNVSSLVVPIGGMGLYPTMVMETWHALFIFETVAHEWAHNYLMFFPLGIGYFTDGTGETRIINETTASIFGKEIGRKVIERYYQAYPDIMQMLPSITTSSTNTAPSPTATPALQPDERPPFDYASYMHYTRITVDFYLSQGMVKQAERFMQGQRRVFATYGYPIRKLNQAFFAFYGGYQAPGDRGAGGSDPIGPALLTLRQARPTIRAWLEQVRTITTRQALLDSAQAGTLPTSR